MVSVPFQLLDINFETLSLSVSVDSLMAARFKFRTYAIYSRLHSLAKTEPPQQRNFRISTPSESTSAITSDSVLTRATID